MIKAKQEKEIIADQLKEDNKHLKKMLPLLPHTCQQIQRRR
jgi:hypothetical protein